MTNEELLKVIEEAKASGATELDLREKGITELPQEICQLDKLETLRLEGNPLCCPPLEICNQGMEAIRQYFAELEYGTQTLDEVKIILAGEGAAGKTSLVKRLFGEGFSEHVDTTLGINIRGWAVETAGRKLKANMWDFGGQDIQRAMHQFFLSKRSLYILVLDVRKDEQPERWLRTIEAFGGESPILIVLNKMDENPSFDLNRSQLRDKFPGIKDFYKVSCKTEDGIAEFRKALEAELVKVEMTAIRWPRKWLVVKQYIEQMQGHYVKAEEYENICKNVGITEEQSCETLLEFLHDLGVAVHFKKVVLDAIHVLKPDWVANAVYKIITAEETDKRGGRISIDSVRNILRQQEVGGYCYTTDERNYIVKLMSHFDMCYNISSQEILIPQVLPADQPNFSFDDSGTLRFAFCYDNFLPPSVFPRFIVKVYKDIEEDKCWRTGVVLKDMKSGVRAVVKEDQDPYRIEIWVQGEHRREYLHYLRYSLADINNSFDKLAVHECIPISDKPYLTVNYETLLKNAEHGINGYFTGDPAHFCDVNKLLGLVQPKSKEELRELADRLDVSPEEKESFLEIIFSIFKPKLPIPFLDINLSEAFKRGRLYLKRRQQEEKK